MTNIIDRRAADSTTIDLDIVIDAPAETVFDFLVQPAKLFRWMGIGGELDAVPGGAYRIRYNDEDVAAGEFVEIDRPRLVSWTWGWEGSDEVPPGSTSVRFELSEAEGRTTVRVVHEGLPTVESADSHAEGWTHFGGQLATEAEVGGTYDDAREVLRAAELDLMLQRERVAELRRDLPFGPTVPDYEFDVMLDGAPESVRLSELFTSPDRPLIVYHFMYGKQQTQPCPMCAMWADGWNPISRHVQERADFVVAASAPIEDWTALAHDRGWTDLRLVSAAPSTFKVDIGGEDADGNLQPFISVFELVDGVPHLTYSGGAHIDGDHWRGVDLLTPVWHLFDLTRNGRENWMPS
ncbi:MAG: DUF899 family protein [Ilumatobacteraceae bacterium]